MQDKSINGALVALRKQIIRGDATRLEHVEALRMMRGVEMHRVIPPKRKDAVRIAPTSGLTLRQMTDGLGMGMSALNKWITAHRDIDVVSKED